MRKVGKMPEAMGTVLAAERWGVKPETVRRWCQDPVLRERMGAEQDGKGRPWRIPYDAECPKPVRNQS